MKFVAPPVPPVPSKSSTAATRAFSAACTSNMRFASPKVDRQVHVWVSGPSRPTANAVELEYLTRIREAWASYLARIEGEEVTTFTEEDLDSLGQFMFIRDGNKS